MKLILNYFSLITVIFLCAGCSNSKKTTAYNTPATLHAPLLGTNWKLSELLGRPINSSSDSNREAHIKFDTDGKTIDGNGGCNTFGGAYQSIDNSHLSFGPIMSTKMYCEDAKYENLFFDVLSKTDNYLINGDTLFLRNSGLDSTAKFIAILKK